MNCSCGREIRNIPSYLEGVARMRCQVCSNTVPTQGPKPVFINTNNASSQPKEKESLDCGHTKPITEFWFKGGSRRDSLCRTCRSAREHKRQAEREAAVA